MELIISGYGSKCKGCGAQTLRIFYANLIKPDPTTPMYFDDLCHQYVSQVDGFCCMRNNSITAGSKYINSTISHLVLKILTYFLFNIFQAVMVRVFSYFLFIYFDFIHCIHIYIGDSGSPVIYRTAYANTPYLIGVFAVGHKVCEPGMIMFFTSIHEHYEWIKKVTKIENL